jgi:hypothetical protein
VARMEPEVVFPLQSFSGLQAEETSLLTSPLPLMQSASTSEFIRIVGSALLVQHSPHALGRYTVLQGFPDNSLRSGWDARTSPLMHFRPASESHLKAADGRTTLPLLAKSGSLSCFISIRPKSNQKSTVPQSRNQTQAGSPELKSCLIKPDDLPSCRLNNRS